MWLVTHLAVDRQNGSVERVVVRAEGARALVAGVARSRNLERLGDLLAAVGAQDPGMLVVGAAGLKIERLADARPIH
jgi:hypothetical protein